ncbi:hypothetical protein BCR33DRAFT_724131 [Rhizoclosmatium globosum]|uniref:Uncharacterized protein n=1 Tax=Rhizoclosmatium globosum TaxID=329046 RepID=A0A1Y2B8T0_9FUNG|nr:hypothetical protein BCR33DRAFT_724131 [Rhizoclosmatium globosum]|eukprot:ORY30897.1 hypothetical protein BCR33DRAFT_724131 [Rhizoclosmatium globosum]
MGLGFSMNGEGVERSNSRLSKSIALTWREAIGNRQLDICLVLEDYGFGKVRSLVSWTRQILKKSLDKLESLVRQGINPTNLPPYVQTVDANKNVRQLLSRRVERVISTPSAADYQEASRLKLENLVRVIVSMEKMLDTHIGTNRASSMKASLSRLRQSRDADIKKHNASFPNSPLSADSLRAGLIISTTSDDGLAAQYWRHLEDVYHHSEHLRNLIGFYEEKGRVFWQAVKDDIDGMDNPLFQAAATFLAERVIEKESFYSQEAQLVLEEVFGTRAEMLFDDKVLREIQVAFDDGTLGSQHSFNS